MFSIFTLCLIIWNKSYIHAYIAACANIVKKIHFANTWSDGNQRCQCEQNRINYYGKRWKFSQFIILKKCHNKNKKDKISKFCFHRNILSMTHMDYSNDQVFEKGRNIQIPQKENV